MSKSGDIFLPTGHTFDEKSIVAAVINCAESFTEKFNARDLIGMDSVLHFPHIILSGENLVVWDAPDNLAPTFFEELISSTGWHHSEYHEKRPVLVGSRKVHLFVRYSRNRADGSPISYHDNLWVFTLENDRWGIKIRSY